MSASGASPPRSPGGKPGRTAETEAREAERRKRLAAALRENLRRRKGPPEETAPSAPGEAAGEPDRD
ncbi:MAG: hypothetical protein DI565_15250 [Ancylobacter novellus]|uniref:Uncharacterized protein n=1 Tax=Ancylobacter novellus TaxID=921 RepID=A0A2W5M6L8_ANCNO|nr:MAG: hypothetical protein DI565_15250 [Ancylobacter novellus]